MMSHQIYQLWVAERPQAPAEQRAADARRGALAAGAAPAPGASRCRRRLTAGPPHHAPAGAAAYTSGGWLWATFLRRTR
jgi:hypothetical protein